MFSRLSLLVSFRVGPITYIFGVGLLLLGMVGQTVGYWALSPNGCWANKEGLWV